MEALVQLSGVTKRYDSGAAAVDEVSLQIGALDTATGEDIGQLLQELNSSGQTMVLVTHNPDLAGRYARRTVQIVDGKVTGNLAALAVRP